jgi:hypothetical protein
LPLRAHSAPKSSPAQTNPTVFALRTLSAEICLIVLKTALFAAGNLGVVVSNDLPTYGSRFLIIDNGRKIDVQIGVPLAEPAVHGGEVV